MIAKARTKQAKFQGNKTEAKDTEIPIVIIMKVFLVIWLVARI